MKTKTNMDSWTAASQAVSNGKRYSASLRKKRHFLDNDFANSYENKHENFQFLLRIGKCFQEFTSFYHPILLPAHKFSRQNLSFKSQIS